MNACKIINLNRKSLAASARNKNLNFYEEKLSGDKSGVFDARAQENLILKCADCGDCHTADARVMAECDTCGCELFFVSRLVVRKSYELPDFEFRITGKRPQRFLHINSKQAKEFGATIYYTSNGSKPDETSSIYKHPLTIARSWQQVKAVAIAPSFYSQIITQALEPETPPPAPFKKKIGQTIPSPPTPIDSATEVDKIIPPSTPPPLPPKRKTKPEPQDKEEDGCLSLLGKIIVALSWIVFLYYKLKN